MNSTDPSHLINVSVQAAYLSDQSAPDDERYVFSYTITIRNDGGVSARLMSRHWVITDANGRVQEVRGEGVVGEQPYLRPGESFRYTSGTVLATPVGSMQGEYEMQGDDGQRFLAPISPFSLSVPRSLH